MISQWKTLQTAPKQLAKYVWKKGQSGNPAGPPPGKTLKEFAREYLMSLANDEKVDYLASLPADVIDHTQNLSGRDIERAYVDKGYRGHDAQNPRRVFISGQKRSVFGAIKREQRRRSAIEPVIGHLKAEGHLGRGYLKVAHEAPPTPSSPPSETTSDESSHG